MKALFEFFNKILIHRQFYKMDKRGVRPFVIYSNANGGYRIECYRRKTKDESKGDSDWQMIRIGYIHSIDRRLDAERKALELAKIILKEFQL